MNKPLSNILSGRNIAIVISIVFVALIIVLASAYTDGVRAAGGPPAHSHAGFPIQKTSSYSYSYTLDIQKDLNWLDEVLSGFNISTLTEDGVYGSGTANAVSTYQSLRNLTVDGIVGNQTWSYLEYDVYYTKVPNRHPLGVGFRYPIYSVCKLVTNNAAVGLDIIVPTREPEAQWTAFQANPPSGVTIADGNCNVSGGGGSGGGTDPPPTGWTSTTCAKMSQICCPSDCTSNNWPCSGYIC